MKTPEQIIEQLKTLYKKADAVSDVYGYMWDEQLQAMEDMIAGFEVAYDKWQESQPGEDQYAEHNTMSHVYQGTK